MVQDLPKAPEDPVGGDAALIRDMRWLAQLARRLAGDANLADDACQEVWSAWDFGDEQSRRPRLARALRRALWFRRRTEQRRQARERRLAAPDEGAASTADLVSRAEDR